MPLDLKPPISTYFDAKNAHDADRVAALFTEDGRVHDERHDFSGRAAIRDWAEGTFRQYKMTQTPKAAREDGGGTLVTAEVAGTFPGSPIELGFRFVVEGERIRELRIG
jgi:ketosteroid isomerase-like protein